MQTCQFPRHNAVLSVKISPWWRVVILQICCRIKSLVAGCHGRHSVLFSLFFHPFLCDSTKHLYSVVSLHCYHCYPINLLIYLCKCLGHVVSVLWATLTFMVRDSNPVLGPVLLPDSICSVHVPCPEVLIPSDQGGFLQH